MHFYSGFSTKREKKLLTNLTSDINFKNLQIAFSLVTRSGILEQTLPNNIEDLSEISGQKYELINSLWLDILDEFVEKAQISNKSNQKYEISGTNSNLYEKMRAIIRQAHYFPQYHELSASSNQELIDKYGSSVSKCHYEHNLPEFNIYFNRLFENGLDNTEIILDEFTKLDFADFSNMNLTGSHFEISKIWNGCSFKDSNLENANITIHPSIQTMLDFRGANLTNSTINSTAFKVGIYNENTKIEGLTFSDPWNFKIDSENINLSELERLTEFYTFLIENSFINLMDQSIADNIVCATIKICNKYDIEDIERATQLAPVAKILRLSYLSDIINLNLKIKTFLDQIKYNRDKIIFLAHFQDIFDLLDTQIQTIYQEQCNIRQQVLISENK